MNVYPMSSFYWHLYIVKNSLNNVFILFVVFVVPGDLNPRTQDLTELQPQPLSVCLFVCGTENWTQDLLGKHCTTWAMVSSPLYILIAQFSF
jgi:hypothetical protein